MERRTFLRGAAIVAANPTLALAKPPNVSSLSALVENQRLARETDCAAWRRVGEITDALEAKGDHLLPKVQTSMLLTAWGDKGPIKVAQYSYSEDDIRKVFMERMSSSLSLVSARNDEQREKVRADYMQNMERKLAGFREQERAYKRREDEAGYTAALEEARETSDAVKAVEAEIIAYVPSTLEEAASKAAWVAWAYDDDYCYICDDGDGASALVAALRAIGRATA